MNFLEYIDNEYDNVKELENVSIAREDFRYYEEISSSDFISTVRFQCLKMDKTKILIYLDGLKIYLSDKDIINIILKMNESDVNWFISKFYKLYRKKGCRIHFEFKGQVFKGVGLPYRNSSQKIMLHTDNEITLNDLIFIINFIFTKDRLATKRYRENFLKSSLCKYISLIKYYYYNDYKMKAFLEEIKYPIDKSIDEIFSSYNRVKKMNQKFNDYKKFEKIT